MPGTEGTLGEARVHAREREFTLEVREVGRYRVLTPVGRYTESLLGILVQDFLDRPGFLAVDLSHLDAVALPLVRALGEYASGLPAGQGRMVLLRPPDKILGLVRLLAREKPLPVLSSEEDLAGDPAEVEARLEAIQGWRDLVRRQLETDPAWQMVDGDSRWLCPFCAKVCPEVRLIARGSPTASLVERVLKHLSQECPAYRPGALQGRPVEVLERELARADRERLLEGPDPTQTMLNISRRELMQKLRKAEEVQKGSGTVEERRRRLLPVEPPALPGCDVAILYRPGPAGGRDFYDILRLADGRAAFLVGGVSGPSVEPAVLMGMARKVLSLRLREISDLGAAMERANEDLYEDLDRQSFVAASVVVWDPKAGEVALARAGQAAPFLVRSEGGVSVLRLEAQGHVLGLVPGSAFGPGMEIRRIPVRSRDLLLIHSDGLEEVRHVTGRRFGADRLAAVLKANAHLDAATVVGAVALEVEHFASGERPLENATALCVRIL